MSLTEPEMRTVVAIFFFFFFSWSGLAQPNLAIDKRNFPDSVQVKQYQTPEVKRCDSLRQNFLKEFETHYRKQSGKAQAEAPDAEVRIIVRLKQEPLARAKKNERAERGLQMALEHRQFVDRIRNSRATAHSKIHQEYKTTFNGFAIITTRSAVEEIRKLPPVSSVVEDRQVKPIDDNSNSIIGADRVWTDYGVTGKGITIGIVDTGIDYSHPALGGGFGPSYKVIGGYDFVNEDNDPMDDHSHGTHVAGIAAANGGGLEGVAPDAKLVAYKVLGADGYGYDSWVLAAVERSVDPDQNPLTDDALDVVNMSLGDVPHKDDPVPEAVNNATLLGVTFVIAAGNSWGFLSVGTPAIAEKAVTVAATDSNDETAWFSSKGPTLDYSIKPDIAAPGVGIYSSIPGNQYDTWDGTSMATPHVAGAVALLLEKHPGWTPEMIKAVLMQTAKKSTQSIWFQGAGRLDVYKAIQQEVFFTPGSISLGVLDKSGGPWQKSLVATLYNYSSGVKRFSFLC
jgi:subtilisin family serine protease